MKGLFTGSLLQFAAILFAAFLILIVNREFGAADNGDFSRYMDRYASKPIDATQLKPPAFSDEWKARFFEQPIVYWSPEIENARAPWFTSASLFWTAGDKLGDIFFSSDVFNMRYVGLPFFLMQFFGLFYLLRRLSPLSAGAALMLLGAFGIMTDARITAFYNSFYAESVPILALFLFFAFFAVEVYRRQSESSRSAGKGLFVCATLIMLLAAIFAKRQYLYFVGPALVFVFYYVHEEFRTTWKFKLILIGGFAIALLAAIAAITSTQRVGSPEEVSASRFTSYHALYFGLLPHSKHPVQLLEKLGLPADSATLIGKSAWNAASMKLVADQPEINVKTFLRAIALDPKAFAGSILQNAGEVGNFAIPLGMTPGMRPGFPPALISGLSTGFTGIAGVGLFGGAILVALALIAFPVGVAAKNRFPSRILALMLVLIVVSDVVISTFDGQQEARKHVLVASIAVVLIVIHGLASIAGMVRRDQSPV